MIGRIFGLGRGGSRVGRENGLFGLGYVELEAFMVWTGEIWRWSLVRRLGSKL